MSLEELLEECGRRFVHLSRRGERVHVQPSFVEPENLTPELIAALRAHRQELLDLLRWEEEADGVLLSSTRYLARAWPKGCALESEEWRRFEGELQKAYKNRDQAQFGRVIREREDYALSLFRSFSRESAT
ncbi:MAG: hypothetical protein M5U22_07235 [Thermoleophilia bacterium]|nr:hypothetical protein [Thermoleophilia bacterium]